MAGTTDWHNLVALNFIALLNQKLPDHCRALGMDVKLRIEAQTSERYYYPDTFVSCGTPLKNEHVHADATLVAEVVSPTTLRFDRGEKMLGYRMLSNIQQYLLIWPDQPFAEVYSRTTNWEMTTVSGPGVLKLDCLGLEVQMKDLYRRVPVVFPEAS